MPTEQLQQVNPPGMGFGQLNLSKDEPEIVRGEFHRRPGQSRSGWELAQPEGAEHILIVDRATSEVTNGKG